MSLVENQFKSNQIEFHCVKKFNSIVRTHTNGTQTEHKRNGS
eukprot:COSAG02_NODE_47747_length_339_cov_0.508333_1_plen_41_part_10